MNRIIEFFVRRALFADILSLAVVGIGLVSALLIRREVFPNVNFDVLQVSTVFPGASAEEVEKLVTNPIEQELAEVDGIKRVVSGSVESLSNIAIFLDPDVTDASRAKEDVKEAVERATDLPEEAREPKVTVLESKQSPIIEISLSGDLDPLALRRTARRLEREIEALPGVARVAFKGLRAEEIRVEISSRALARYRLSLEDVVRALRNQNIAMPAGSLDPPVGKGIEKVIRTVGDFQSLDDIRKTVVRANELGRPILVGDVAKVFTDLERASILNRTNGHPSIALTVLKKEKADAIGMVKAIRSRMEALKPSLEPGLSLTYINDFSIYVERRLGVLTGNLWMGLLLVLIVLPLTIPIRYSLMIAIGIPFAFLGALALFYNLGNSFNLISMLGFIIVSGMLVDDAIVVTENSARLIEEEGMDPTEAAIKGATQVFFPVMASVATTMMVFFPMMNMSGIFGKFIREIPIGVIVCLVASLLESFLILPSHISHFVRVRAATRKDSQGSGLRAEFSRFNERMAKLWETRLIPGYLRCMDFTLRWRYGVAFTLLLLFGGTLALALTRMKFILFPREGIEIFFVRAELPSGTGLAETAERMKPVEELVATLPKSELDAFTTTIGLVQQDPNDPNTKRGSEYAQIAVYLTPESARDRTADAIVDDLRQRLGERNEFVRLTFDRVNPGPPTGRAISIGVQGEHYEDIRPAVAALKEYLASIPGVTDVADSFAMGKEEVRVRVLPNEAAAAGLSVAQVGQAVRAAFEGVIATSLRSLNEKTDVRVSFPRSERSSAQSLEDVVVPNPAGNLVPLTSIATFEKAQSLAIYEHENNRRQIKVTADVDGERITSVEANNRVRAHLPELRKKFPGIRMEFGGEDEDTKESLASLGRAFGVSVIGIFLILVLTFRTLLQPLLVLLTIPLGIIAAIVAFYLHGMPLSFLGGVGIIALAGVIVNNAIVFVDFVNQGRASGLDRWESIRSAARIRARPIFLTTVTTVVGVLPTAYGLGGEDKFVVPIAMALGWGLFFGSLLTVFVFPSAIAVLDDYYAFLERKLPRLANFYKG